MCIFQWYQYSQLDTNLAYRLMTNICKMLGRPNYNVVYNNEATHFTYMSNNSSSSVSSSPFFMFTFLDIPGSLFFADKLESLTK
jgi:predicted LPLAT superfamily acyltransferase